MCSIRVFYFSLVTSTNETPIFLSAIPFIKVRSIFKTLIKEDKNPSLTVVNGNAPDQILITTDVVTKPAKNEEESFRSITVRKSAVRGGGEVSLRYFEKPSKLP